MAESYQIQPYMKELLARDATFRLHTVSPSQRPYVLPMSKAAVYDNKAYAPFLRQRVRPKDAIDLAKQDGVVYQIPCGGGKVFIGESGRPTQVRTKEHDRDIRLANN